MIALLVAMVFPRVTLVLVYLSSDLIQRAFAGLLMPVLGFLFMPATTAAYAWIVGGRHPISGSYLAALAIAVLIDAGAWSEATRPKAQKSRIGSSSSAGMRYDD
jgi:hypothetical protein